MMKNKEKVGNSGIAGPDKSSFLANTLNTAAYIARMKREETIEIFTECNY